MTKFGDTVLRPIESVEGERINSETIDKRLKDRSTDVHEWFTSRRATDERDPLVVAVLFGAIFVYADFIRKLPKDFAFCVGTIRAKSYYENGVRGDVAISHPAFDCAVNEGDFGLKNRKVLLVDDIAESGQTLHELKKWFLDNGASDVKTLALLDKPTEREYAVELDWFGFRIPGEKWVYGYGLDNNNRFRHFSNVVELKKARKKSPK